MNQTIAFQSRVLFLVSGFQKKKMQEKIDIFCERQVHHSSEMEDFVTFSLLPDYVEATYF